MAAKKQPTPSAETPKPNRRAKHGADPHTAAAERKKHTSRHIDSVSADAVHDTGDDLVAKSTAGITQLSRDQHPGFGAHRKGHDMDQEVKSLAHIYTPWANVRANGSGILAVAAWSKRLQEEGKQAIREEGKDLEPFIRGLIHR